MPVYIDFPDIRKVVDIKIIESVESFSQVPAAVYEEFASKLKRSWVKYVACLVE